MELRITPREGHTDVVISGVIDEDSDLGPLVRLRGPVRIDLSGVRRLNSYGCRQWMDALRQLGAHAKLTFVACSPAVVDQLNTTYGFLGHGVVESFRGLMVCENCDHSFEHLFVTRDCAAGGGHLPDVACPKCHGKATLDDNPEHFLLFLREPTQVG